MPSFDRFRLGIIGFGYSKVYATAFSSAGYYYRGLPLVDLVGIAAAHESTTAEAARQFGFQRQTTDYRDLLADDAINTIVIDSPNYLHVPMLLNALRTDKAIYIDKPLANSLQEARQAQSLARELGRDAQIVFENRFCPAVQYARELVVSGRLGQIYSFRAWYYRSSYADPTRPLRWKGSARLSGTGVLADLGSHIIDLVMYLSGESPRRVFARLRTIIPERNTKDGLVPVDTDDHCLVQAELPGGALGTFEAARVFTGAQNDIGVELYGEKASLRWNLMDPNFLYLADSRMPEAERGWLQVPTIQRYSGAVLPGPDVPVGQMRFHIASAEAFMRATLEGRPYDPGLEQGTRVQAVMEAAVASSQSGKWEDVQNIS